MRFLYFHYTCYSALGRKIIEGSACSFTARIEIDKKMWQIDAAALEDKTLIQAAETVENHTEFWAADTAEDIQLTQVAQNIENHWDFWSETDVDFTLSQALDAYEVNRDDLANFDIDLFELGLHTSNTKVEVDENTKSGSEARFFETVSKKDVENLIQSTECKNTKKATAWDVRVWESWREERNTHRHDNMKIPMLKNMSASELNGYLTSFVLEARKKDKDEYPSSSVYLLACGILRHLRDLEIYDMNFLSENDHRFVGFRKALDAKMKLLTAMGKGAVKKQADPLGPKEENILWESGQFGCENGQALLNTVYFYNCKLFGFRGRDEHRDLCVGQFTFGKDETAKYVEFTGRASKTLKGGLKTRKLNMKQVRHYSSRNDERCIVSIYEKYIAAIGGTDSPELPFYWKPLQGPGIRFAKQVLGVKTLGLLTKRMCEAAKLPGQYTSHSGKRTCASTLYQKGVPEDMIMQRTGHRSVEGVRAYKRASTAMMYECSKHLDPPSPAKKVDHDGSSMSSDSVDRSTINKGINGNINPSRVLQPTLATAQVGRPIFTNCNVYFL